MNPAMGGFDHDSFSEWDALRHLIVTIALKFAMYTGIAITFIGSAMLAQAPVVAPVPNSQQGSGVSPNYYNPANIPPGWAGILLSVSGMVFSYLAYKSSEKEKDRAAAREDKKYEERIQKAEQRASVAEIAASTLKDRVNQVEAVSDDVKVGLQTNAAKIGSSSAIVSVFKDDLEGVKKVLRDQGILKEDDQKILPRINALLVEDEVTAARAMTTILSRENIDVTHAVSINEAKVLISHMNFVAVILDVMLPDGSGTDLIQFIKDSDYNCKVIVVTGITDQAEIDKVMNLKPSNFLSKPVTLNQLVNAIRG